MSTILHSVPANFTRLNHPSADSFEVTESDQLGIEQLRQRDANIKGNLNLQRQSVAKLSVINEMELMLAQYAAELLSNENEGEVLNKKRKKENDGEAQIKQHLIKQTASAYADVLLANGGDLSKVDTGKLNLAVTEYHHDSLPEFYKNDASESGGSITDAIEDAINSIGENYLSIWEAIATMYANFYNGYDDIPGLSDIIENFASYIDGDTGENSNGDIILHIDELRAALIELRDAWADIPLFGPPGVENEAEAKAWAEELGFTPVEHFVIELDDGTFSVRVDTGPIDDMIADLDALGKGNVTLNSAEFQAWKTGFDTNAKEIETKMQTILQDYSNANSLYDNIVKVLSSTITALLECNKNFLQF